MKKRKIQKFLNLVITVILSILLYTCDTTENDIVTDPRKFSWALDTLTSPRTDQSLRSDIWGSATNDVYTVGFVDAGGGEMWHYNEGEWKSIPLHINQGGFLTIPFSLNAIEGFSRSNIFSGGSNDINYPEFQSFILHFNGIEWKEVNTPNVGVVINLTIIHSNEIYGGSASKFYLHFDGATWAKDSVNIVIPPNALTRFTGFGEYNNQIFCFFEYVTEDGTSAVYYFLKKNTTSWAVIDSFVIDQSHYTYKWGDKLKNLAANLYCFGSSSFLMKYNGNSWETVLNEKFIFDIYGPNSDNMFAVGYPGKAFHYNGSDWYEISQLNNSSLIYSGVWFNGEEAFICGNKSDYPQKSIVWHGKEMKPSGKILLVVCIAAINIFLHSCDTQDNDVINDPRKFSWSIDSLISLRTDQSSKFDIWGRSITDVYTVGFVDAGGSQMWHFDGGTWEFVPLQITEGDPLAFPFSLSAIEGFSGTNIYAGGDKAPNYPEWNSLIIHFNGIEWQEMVVPDIGVVGNLAIIKQSELYGGGTGKYFLRFDGTNWTKDSINIITPENALIHITDFGEYNGDIFCLYDYQTEDATLAAHYFLKKNITTWTVVDSFIIDQTHYTYRWGEHLKNLSDGYLYCFGSSELLRFDGNSWITILSEKHILDVYGPNSNSMFAVGYPGKAFHYNGTDWYEIGQLNNPTLYYTGIWFNGEEAFICGNTIGYPEKSIVWHGKK